MGRPRPLPAPPAPLPAIDLQPWSSELWRIQNAPHWTARVYPAPRFRFDAPTGEFATVYACADQIATFAEVYRERGRRLGPGDADRYLVRLTPTRLWRLVDLRDPVVLVALGLDERIGVGDDCAACQAWSRAFFVGYPAAQGIAYRSRLAEAAVTNVALFASRCDSTVEVRSAGRLRDLEALVLAAADRYDLTVAFPFGG